VRRFVLLLSCLLFSPLLLTAQRSDAHFLSTRIAPVVQRSAFVHGYLHGYEEGFHQADFDLQMGRISRGEYTRDAAPTGFRREFGSKHMFNDGFHNGFQVGYADGASGRRFRAIETVLVATGNTESENAGQPGTYDEGIRSGYAAGQHQGLDDARRQAPSKPSPACPINSGRTKEAFCSAYASGYEMGYSDGFTNQAKTTLAEAAK
jgi:hypothetical protein